MRNQIFNARNRIEADKFPDEEILSESINNITLSQSVGGRKPHIVCRFSAIKMEYI